MQHLLSGIRILDFTRALAGPTVTRMFAEMGADVIKVEGAPGGEMGRNISKHSNVAGGRTERSLYHIQQNLNKKSLCIDFNSPAAMDLLRELVPHCDVVVENFRPGVIAKLGFGYDSLQRLRPDIILCSVSALGQQGPLSQKPGYDYIAQAYSGVTSMIGDAGQAPNIPLAAVGDISTGMHGAFAVAAALLHRARTGQGQWLDIAILDAYYHYHEVSVHQCSASGGAIQPTRAGRQMSYVCPAGVFKVNGEYIIMMAFLHHWADLCRAMERPELEKEPRYLTDGDRLKCRDEVVALVEDWLKRFPGAASAVEYLDSFDVPCAPVLSIAQTLTHPHLLQRGTVRTVKDRLAGEFQMPGMPIKTSGYPANNELQAPLLGEHNAELLSGLLGKSAAEIAALEQAGVLHSKMV
jgi:crotonobetainyl-CoA:carnitine CoA-transferase CaiB-like acyl-CoA transferase